MAAPPLNDPHEVAQARLESAVRAAFPSEGEGEPEPDTARSWLAGMIDKGLTRVYAVHLAECFEVRHQQRLVERVRERTGDGKLAGLLAKVLQAWAQPSSMERQGLVRLLGPVAFEGIDRALQQARTVGRDRTSLHLTAARWGEELVVLADPEPKHAWLLAATQKRVQEALAVLGVYPTAAQTQVLDLVQGDTLHLLGYEFRLVGSRRGGSRVQYKRIEAATGWEGEEESTRPSPSAHWLLAPLRWLLGPRTAATPTSRAPAIDVPFPGVLERAGSLRAFLSYSLPLPTWDQMGLMLRAGCKKWPWLPPAFVAAVVLFWLYLRGGSVGGTVQNDGRSVEQGWVVFEPADSSQEQGTSRLTARIENGKYRLSGLDPGTYSAVVLVPDLKTRPGVQVDVGYVWTTQNFDLDAQVLRK